MSKVKQSHLKEYCSVDVTAIILASTSYKNGYVQRNIFWGIIYGKITFDQISLTWLKFLMAVTILGYTFSMACKFWGIVFAKICKF